MSHLRSGARAAQLWRASRRACLAFAPAPARRLSAWRPPADAARARLDNLLARRLFVVPAFELHGGVSGLFDLGPPGCALKENVLALWRRDFVLEEALLQVECTALTPHAVLKASGHVDRFEDLMVRDLKSGECLRADKLLEDFVEATLRAGVGPAPLKEPLTQTRRDELRRVAAQAGTYSATQLHDLFGELGVRSPSTGAELSPPFAFNLMFQTSIGPTGQLAGFLRPETAQGIFVNFRRLYEYHAGRLPMGVAQIGSAFRNEIAPRGGLLRVREFTLAEIEYFVHPEHKRRHAKFSSVSGARLPLLPAAAQLGDSELVTPTLSEAVAQGTIGNETLAYFMARTSSFLLKLGVRPEGLRFRQHLPKEMAHYASDCWDAEILMAHGWVECAGLADRGSYDLQAHASASGVELVARELLAEPRDEEVWVARPNRPAIGRAFRTDRKAVLDALDRLAAAGRGGDAGDAAAAARLLAFQEQLGGEAGAAMLDIGGGRQLRITRDMVAFAREAHRVSERKFAPHVIEPSFGIGRILTGVLEHSFYVRPAPAHDGGPTAAADGVGELARSVLALPPLVAPFKAVLLPLDGRVPREQLQALAADFVAAGLSVFVDDSSGSVGRRYARADELGVPFAITIDFESARDGKATLRERDSMTQVRLPAAGLARVLKGLCEGTLSWDEVSAAQGAAVAPSDSA